MIKMIYSVKDVKSGFGPLMAFDNDPVATRAFAASVNDPSSLMCFMAKDFALYCLGSYDDDIGNLNSTDTPALICEAIDVKKESD